METKSSESWTVHINSVPTDIIFQVLEKLDYASDVNALSQTCKGLEVIANGWLYFHSHFPRWPSAYGIHRIAEKGNADAIRRLLPVGGPKLQKSLVSQVYEFSPVRIAIKNGHIEFVRALIQAHGQSLITGTDLNNPRTCLCLAVSGGYTELLKLMLTTGLRCDDSEPAEYIPLNAGERRTLLSYAAESGSLSTVKFFVEEVHCNVNILDANKQTPFHWAVKSGNLEVVQFLIESDAVPTIIYPSRPRIRPIYLAACLEHSHIVKFLLERGAHPDVRTTDCLQQLLQIMDPKPHSMILNLLRVLDSSEKPLTAYREQLCDVLDFPAICGGDNWARWILNVGPRPSGHVISCGIPLVLKLAFIYDNVHIVKILLDEESISPRMNRFSPDEQRHGKIIEAGMHDFYHRPILLSIRHDRCHILEMIFDHGPSDLVSKTLVKTAILCAQGDTSPKNSAIESLLSRGALDNLKNSQIAYDLLDGALRLGHFTIVQKILSVLDMGPLAKMWTAAGEPVGMVQRRFPFNLNVLELAAGAGNIEIFHMLLSKGKPDEIRLDSNNDSHKTALCCALYNGQVDIVRLFLDNGFHANSSCCIYADNDEKPEALLVKVFHKRHMEKTIQKLHENPMLETTQLLLQYGADPNSTGIGGKTALFHASSWECADIPTLELLVESGANPFLGFDVGLSPIQATFKSSSRYHKHSFGAQSRDTYMAARYLKVIEVFLKAALSHGYYGNGLIRYLRVMKEELQEISGDYPLLNHQIMSEYGMSKAEESLGLIHHLEVRAAWKKFQLIKMIQDQYWRAIYPV